MPFPWIRPKSNRNGRLWRSGAWRSALKAQSGASLIETLIAAAVFLVIAVGLFPIFHRATENNVLGSYSSLVAQQGRGFIERSYALSVDDQYYDFNNPLPTFTIEDVDIAGVTAGGEQMVSTSQFWDPYATIDPTKFAGFTTAKELAPVLTTDGAWVLVPPSQDGTGNVDAVAWRHVDVIRHYSYADISSGVVDATLAAGSTPQLVTLGDETLFDNPLDRNALSSQSNLKEQEVRIQRRYGNPTSDLDGDGDVDNADGSPNDHSTRFFRAF